MKSYGAAAVCAAALLYSSSAAAERGGCDRACLEGFLDFYIAAVVAHDATLLPLARDVEFTEKGQRLPLGDGLWHTATGRGGYALKLADVERGQAVLMGTIRESGEPTVLVARLGIEGRRVADADTDVRGRATQGAVAEIETLVIRDAEVAARLDEIGTPRRAWSEGVAVERTARLNARSSYCNWKRTRSFKRRS